jgi:hypothetical protein
MGVPEGNAVKPFVARQRPKRLGDASPFGGLRIEAGTEQPRESPGICNGIGIVRTAPIDGSDADLRDPKFVLRQLEKTEDSETRDPAAGAHQHAIAGAKKPPFAAKRQRSFKRSLAYGRR